MTDKRRRAGKRQQRVLAGADAVALLGSFALALALHDPGGAMEGRLLRHNPVLLCLNILAVVCLWGGGLPSLRLVSRAGSGNARMACDRAEGVLYAALVTVLVGFLALLDVSRITVVTGYLLSVPAVASGRAAARFVMRSFYANPRTATPLVIVGFNRFARRICDEVLDAMTPYEVMCFLDQSAAEGQYRGCPIIGPVEKLPELIKVCPSLEVAIVLPDGTNVEQERIAELCERHQVRWSSMPWVSRLPAGGISVEMFGAVPLITPRGSKIEGLEFHAQTHLRCGGRLGWILALLSPILLIGGFAVWICDGPPVLFSPTAGGAARQLVRDAQIPDDARGGRRRVSPGIRQALDSGWIWRR